MTSRPFYTHVQAVKGFANIAVSSCVDLEHLVILKAKVFKEIKTPKGLCVFCFCLLESCDTLKHQSVFTIKYKCCVCQIHMAAF